MSRAWFHLRGLFSHRVHAEKYQDDDHRVPRTDPAPQSEQVKIWMWFPGLIATLLITCAVMTSEFNMPVGEVLLALFLAFFFSFLAIQATGVSGE